MPYKPILINDGRRHYKTIEQKKIEKSEYDKEYRSKNHDKIQVNKKEYFKRTYNPEKAAIERKKIMPRHIEYCRQPKYKAYKKRYDQQYRVKKVYGEFSEAALIFIELDNILESQKIKIQQGLICKTQKRRKQWKNSQQTI